MREHRLLTDNWSLLQLATPQDRLEPDKLPDQGWLPVSRMPAQVHDILREHRILSDKILTGWCDEAAWVGDCDWVYRCVFPAHELKSHMTLHFKGVDTVADIYLNGKRIAAHDNFYLPAQADVTALLKPENELVVHFHNASDAIARLPYLPEWEGMVDRWKVLRKPGHDHPTAIAEGSNYQGAHRFFTPVGLYDDVVLEMADEVRITGDRLTATLNEDYSAGTVDVAVTGVCPAGNDNALLRVRVFDDREELAAEGEVPFPSGDGEGTALCSLQVRRPKLWHPRGFGEQALYTVRAELSAKSGADDARIVYDRLEKRIGFRDVVMDGAFNFKINGKIVRLWGGSMDPFQGYTHCWQPDRVRRLLDMTENANMNILRCWGEGIPYRDELYEEADRRGILIWQEFFMGYGAYPDTPDFRRQCREEAEFLIKRLRHHACLLMWCGGNETRMGAEYTDRDRPFYGEAIICEDYPELVERLDPGRYYHESSPSGGAWSNDPEQGDHHTYDCIWYYNGGQYPNMVSEHIRTAPPVMHSLRRFIDEESFWPEGYTGALTYRDRFPLPDSWMERVNISADMHLKTGPIWEYYDADTPEETVYRFGAAYGKEMRQGLERVRMGSPDGGLYRKQRSRGHLSCKLNDTWPKIYCAIIDFFGEGYIPYYATKRGQEPILVCFDIRERINLWLVNDSAEDIRGTITFALFNPAENRFTNETSIEATMPQGQSDIVLNLDELKFFRRTNLLYAKFEDADGNKRAESIDFVAIERHMRFPDAKLQARLEGDTLVVSTDRFAHCVEIVGDDKGDRFGWMFEDNYFDLLPGDEKRVRILGHHREGNLTLKPHYSSTAVTLPFRR